MEVEGFVLLVIAFQVILDAIGLAMIAVALLAAAVFLVLRLAVVVHAALNWLAGRIVRLGGINRDFVFLLIGLMLDVHSWTGWVILAAI